MHLATTDPAAGSPPRRIRAIMEAVAAFYMVSPLDLVSPRRAHNLMQPRHVAWFLCRRLTRGSFLEIGRHFRRHHAAVLHGVRGIARRIADDVELAAQIAALEAELRSAGLSDPRAADGARSVAAVHRNATSQQ